MLELQRDKHIEFRQYLYDGLILFSPNSEKFGGSLDVAAILDFVDSGKDLIVDADSKASDLIPSITAECGVDFDEMPSTQKPAGSHGPAAFSHAAPQAFYSAPPPHPSVSYPPPATATPYPPVGGYPAPSPYPSYPPNSGTYPPSAYPPQATPYTQPYPQGYPPNPAYPPQPYGSQYPSGPPYPRTYPPPY